MDENVSTMKVKYFSKTAKFVLKMMMFIQIIEYMNPTPMPLDC